MSYSERLLVENEVEQERLIGLFPSVGDPKVAADELVRISYWLHASLDARGDSLSDGPLEPEVRKKARKDLQKLALVLTRASQSLSQLEGLARQHLLKRVGRFGRDWRSNADLEMRHVIDILGQWESNAKDTAFLFKGAMGAPKVAAARAAISDLIDLWTSQTGSKPTLNTDHTTGQKKGPFLDLCSEVLSDVYKAHGINCPSVANLIQEQIYPPKRQRSR